MPMPPDDSALSLLPDHPLAAHNTFGIGARARFAARITDAAQFAALHRDPRIANLPQLVLGGGSNVVFTRDFDGVVLLDEIAGRRVVREDDDAWYVEAGGGETWHAFVAWTLEHGMPGLENLALIPGTVGAIRISKRSKIRATSVRNSSRIATAFSAASAGKAAPAMSLSRVAGSNSSGRRRSSGRCRVPPSMAVMINAADRARDAPLSTTSSTPPIAAASAFTDSCIGIVTFWANQPQSRPILILS